MTLWDLFTSPTNGPSSIGGLVFLIADFIGGSGVLSIRFAPPKGYQNFWYWGQLIQLLIINAWYIAAACLFRACPSIIDGWPCGLSFWPQGQLQTIFCPRGSLWLHYGLGSSCFYPYPFPHVSLDQQCLWSLGSPGQLFDLSGSILPGRKGLFWENL